MEKNKTLLLYILLSTFVIILVTYYIRIEQNIYYWDFKGYWKLWEELAVKFGEDPLAGIRKLRHTIRYDDYNSLPVAIIAIFYEFPISPRLSYILSLFVIYFIPVVILFSLVFAKYDIKDKKLATFLGILLPATFVAFWSPTLRGYPDISGFFFVLLSVFICTKHDLALKIDWKKAILVGMVLWAPFLLRRWYAYTVVSLYFSLPVLNFVLFSKDHFSIVRFKNILFNFFISGVATCFFAILLQGPLLTRIIHTDYAVIYSAYQNTMAVSLTNLLRYTGGYLLPFVVIAVLGCVLRKFTYKQSVFIIFCLFNLFFSFFIFTRTQTPGIQHVIPFSGWILFVAMFGVVLCLESIKRTGKLIFLGGCVAVCSLGILYYSLFDNDSVKGLDNILPQKNLPLKVDNYTEYQALASKLESLTSNSDDKITVLSSNNVLNDDMLTTISSHKLDGKITYTSQVDLRDGINIHALLSRYFVVTDPVQLHLHPSGQRVIAIPTNALLNKENIGNAFTKMSGPYKLSNAVNAWIYKRIRPYSAQEVNDFFNAFYIYYPDWKSIYSSGLASAYLNASVMPGDKWGAFALQDDGSIFAHPGENTPTRVNWRMAGIKTLSISAVNTTCNADDVVLFTITSAGKSSTVKVPKGKTEVLDVSEWQNIDSTVAISKNVSVGCDSIVISGR